jgi:thiamine biosynthesis lipoprotein
MFHPGTFSASLFLLTTLLVSACSPNADDSLQQLQGQTMGTTFSVSIVGKHSILPSEITELLADLDGSMSTYRDESELMQLNRAPLNSWVSVSAPLFEVLRLSQEVSAFSGGAFDISIAPLVNLWGFGPQLRSEDFLPETSTIETLLADTGFEYLLLDPEQQSVMKTRDISLDLSAVAKGYAADQVAELLDSSSLENYLVEIGGEIRSKGHNAQGQPWRIAIENPQPGSGPAALRRIEVNTAGIATSGDYRNFFMLNGVRYSHTLDPDTGYPISHSLVSVTVIADSAARADALATAFLVMGEARARALAEEANIAAYFLRRTENDFSETYSSTFRNYLSEMDDTLTGNR